VTDAENNSIQIFNSNGQFVRKFGSEGEENGQMQSPIGVGLLSNGNIVVAEDNNRVQIFDFEGNFVRMVGAGQVKHLAISLLILKTTSWWLIETAIAFRCSTKMAITSKPLELGSSHLLAVFAWIEREGLLSAKVVMATESPSFSS